MVAAWLGIPRWLNVRLKQQLNRSLEHEQEEGRDPIPRATSAVKMRMKKAREAVAVDIGRLVDLLRDRRA